MVEGEEKRFPVHPEDRRTIKDCPASIPWAVIEPFRKQAMSNHDQTLERLAQRGGLGLVEIYAVMHGTDYYDLRKAGKLPSDEEALTFALSLNEATTDT